MNNRFLFNAVVSSYYDIDTPEHYEEFEPQIYLKNVDLFSDEIGIDYDRLLDAVQAQLKLEKPEISQIIQHFEDNSNSNSEEYVTIKPDRVLQCTGLKDKNGKLIYEGDIVEFYSQSLLDALSRKGLERRIGKVVWNDEYLKFDVVVKNNAIPDLCKSIDDNNFIIIGNIYENKELLESED